MNFLNKKEQKLINTFLKEDMNWKVENKDSLNYINKLIKNSLKLNRLKEKKIDLNIFKN